MAEKEWVLGQNVGKFEGGKENGERGPESGNLTSDSEAAGPREDGGKLRRSPWNKGWVLVLGYSADGQLWHLTALTPLT